MDTSSGIDPDISFQQAFRTSSNQIRNLIRASDEGQKNQPTRNDSAPESQEDGSARNNEHQTMTERHRFANDQHHHQQVLEQENSDDGVVTQQTNQRDEDDTVDDHDGRVNSNEDDDDNNDDNDGNNSHQTKEDKEIFSVQTQINDNIKQLYHDVYGHRPPKNHHAEDQICATESPENKKRKIEETESYHQKNFKRIELFKWCQINYYETSERIATFTGQSKTVIIDGYTNPITPSDRFSLGILTNVNRTRIQSYIRDIIGTGIELTKDTRSIKLRCTSDCTVFVQAAIGNLRLGWDPQTVVKVQKHFDMVVFDSDIFYNVLMKAIETEKYEDIYSLESLSRIKLSFVKGWGSKYKLNDVSSAPCWLDIQLVEPLEVLDTVLQEFQRFEFEKLMQKLKNEETSQRLREQIEEEIDDIFE